MERVGNEPGGEGLVAFFIDPIHFRQLADIVEAPKSSLYFMIRRAKVLPMPGTFFRIVVSAVLSSTRVPGAYFSVRVYRVYPFLFLPVG